MCSVHASGNKFINGICVGGVCVCVGGGGVGVVVVVVVDVGEVVAS